MKNILVCGAGGFIGTHLVNSLREQGHYVVGADLKYPEFSETQANSFYLMDLRSPANVNTLFEYHKFDEVYQLAADMGGAGYISTGANDSDIMHNSVMINLNVLDSMKRNNVNKVFYSSTACVYPEQNQTDVNNVDLREHTAYPANPDSEYGWEKLFSERLYLSYKKNYNFEVRIARLHNVFGPYGTYDGGKEKAPAALCRKIAMADDNGVVEIWGPGTQTRSFLYIDECIEGIHRIMDSDYNEPLNLGSEQMITINDLALLISSITNKRITIKNIDGPMGVMGRTSNNKLIEEVLEWKPKEDLLYGLTETYRWINEQVTKNA